MSNLMSKSETTSNRNPKVTWGDEAGRRAGRRGTFGLDFPILVRKRLKGFSDNFDMSLLY